MDLNDNKTFAILILSIISSTLLCLTLMVGGLYIREVGDANASTQMPQQAQISEVQPTTTLGTQPTATLEVQPTATPKPAKQGAVMGFYGDGDTVKQFHVPVAGQAMIGSHYLGDSNFSIQCTNCEGFGNTLWVNTIGEYDGQTFVDFKKPGNYTIEIKAQGRDKIGFWTLSIVTAGEIPDGEVDRMLTQLEKDTIKLKKIVTKAHLPLPR